ncbi:hypothetical protein DERF_004874 [Dermatophagoides farinae]|uniref:Uncharacterized protein n=1 Tax=Dermatophagoides farinae TaxID=6954 RepID=A0A922L5N4_DERFA|nr:hypothetical protein DERF_004874 [Dermatophagoides farinae]
MTITIVARINNKLFISTNDKLKMVNNVFSHCVCNSFNNDKPLIDLIRLIKRNEINFAPINSKFIIYTAHSNSNVNIV